MGPGLGALLRRRGRCSLGVSWLVVGTGIRSVQRDLSNPATRRHVNWRLVCVCVYVHVYGHTSVLVFACTYAHTCI